MLSHFSSLFSCIDPIFFPFVPQRIKIGSLGVFNYFIHNKLLASSFTARSHYDKALYPLDNALFPSAKLRVTAFQSGSTRVLEAWRKKSRAFHSSGSARISVPSLEVSPFAIVLLPVNRISQRANRGIGLQEDLLCFLRKGRARA